MSVAAQPPPTSADPALPEALKHIPAVLRLEFPEPVDPRDVERTVAETYAELASTAKVASFLPILTEKVARDRLVVVTGRRGRRRAA
jgi:hypothetical protein